MEGHGDATWGKLKESTKNGVADSEQPKWEPADICSYIVTSTGAALLAKTKKLGYAADSSMDAERGPSIKVSEQIEFLRDAEAACGTPIDTPTLLTTDNHPNQLVINGETSATRSRHLLRRYLVLQQRVANQTVMVRHVGDTENPADFLTKWVSKDKFDKSIEYLTNSKNAVDATPPE